MTARLQQAAMLLVVLGLGVACQSIAGIEERRLGPCGEYCDTVMRACTGENAPYATVATCMGVCERLPEGSSIEPESSNSVACRLAQARAALLSEPDVHCLRAGPAGDERCGERDAGISVGCESYCMLYQKTCGSQWYTYGPIADCARQCSALRDREAFDVIRDHDGDTLQCRLVHVSAATVEPETHCGHAAMAPPVAPCTDPSTEPPDCKDYCRVVSVACQQEYAQYEDIAPSSAQCLAVCAALPPGTNADTSVNSVGCRLYHAYNSLLDPAVHCPHAGPAGDGHCGTVGEAANSLCDAYCQILQRACPDAYAASFAFTSCSATCQGLPDATRDSHYAVPVDPTLAQGKTLRCRMLHAVRALAGTAGECAAAIGAEICM